MSAVAQLQARILQMVQAVPEGVALEHLKRETKAFQPSELSAALQELLKQKRVTVAKQAHGHVVRAVSATHTKLAGLAENDRLVYDLLEEAGNKGLYVNDLAFKSKLPSTLVTRSLKALVGRQVVKEVKGIASKTRKLYMLASLEPSTQVTGGTWYTEAGDYDIDFIRILQNQVLRRIKEKKYCSTQSLVEWVAASEISNVPLYEQDLQDIVNTLLYDGLVEEVEDMAGGAGVLYKVVEVPTAALPTPLSTVPCGTCPVFDQCSPSPSSSISPYSCPYLTEWLAMT
eukprot:TRINITY_DN415_c0_g1_i1.p2 TRINITY_DN415_c0_g1~~TRINITY_DN415_c0_g1_i1.p2  ORF type:complete len:286 (+),score=133.11 TRINITY_DN415_c0_g1_i1:89-946(+)